MPDTLEAMEGDAELQTTLAALAQRGQAALTREERLQRQRSLDVLGVPPFEQVLRVGREWVRLGPLLCSTWWET